MESGADVRVPFDGTFEICIEKYMEMDLRKQKLTVMQHAVDMYFNM